MGIPTRKPMYQPSIPFVDMYINTVDVLRCDDGKPRTLVSFSHDIYAGTGGFWTIELFDPSYIGMEELLTNTAVQLNTDASSGTETDTGDERSHVNISLVKFRYGYAGHDHNQIVSSVSPEGNEFYWGTVHAYVPRYEVNGTYLTIRGDSAGSRIAPVPMVYNSFPNMSIFQIFKFVCKQNDWELVNFSGESLEELEEKLDALPRDFLIPDGGALDTEALQVTHRMRQNEDPLDFLNRLCAYVRTAGTDYNNFICRLECRISGDKPIRRLYFGAETFDQGPIRDYIYMRDPKSDVISFAPNVQVWVASLTGAAGMTYKMDSARTGEMPIYTVDEVNRELHKLKDFRSKVAFTHSDLGNLQRGYLEPDTGERAEGHGSGAGSAANPVATKQDDQGTEMTVPVNDVFKADEQALQYWLAMQSFVNRATLEVVGDPDGALAPGRTIVVYVYVPVEEDQVRMHWTSTIWTIIGVNHEIRGGEMRTRMELTRLGWDRGGVLTKRATTSYNEHTSTGKQQRTDK